MARDEPLRRFMSPLSSGDVSDSRDPKNSTGDRLTFGAPAVAPGRGTAIFFVDSDVGGDETNLRRYGSADV